MSKQTSTVHAPKVGRGLAICLRDVVSEFADGQRVSTGKASVVIEIRGGWSIKTKSYIKIEFVQGSRILIKMNKAAKNKKPEEIVTTLISGDLRVELTTDIVNGNINVPDFGPCQEVVCYLCAGDSLHPTHIPLKNFSHYYQFGLFKQLEHDKFKQQMLAMQEHIAYVLPILDAMAEKCHSGTVVQVLVTDEEHGSNKF